MQSSNQTRLPETLASVYLSASLREKGCPLTPPSPRDTLESSEGSVGVTVIAGYHWH